MPRIRNWKDLKWFRPTASEVYRNINDLFTKDAVDWDLIACHFPDMLQVAQSIQAGRISPSTILQMGGKGMAQRMDGRRREVKLLAATMMRRCKEL